MPIPNENFNAVLFLSELQLQCDLFNNCIQKLERASAHWKKLVNECTDDGEKNASPLNIVSDCIVCLSAMASIYRILNPSRADEKKKIRSKKLCELLNNPNISNITSVVVRNDWEHFDERLGSILEKRFVGKTSITEVHVSPDKPKDGTIVLRRFEPSEFAIYFNENAASLKPCFEEMKELSDLINKAFVKLQSEIWDIN